LALVIGQGFVMSIHFHPWICPPSFSLLTNVVGLGAQTVTHLDVADLEVDATPEDLMLSYVSGEKGKVREAGSLLLTEERFMRTWSSSIAFASWQ
jgi:hypothetical protein